MPLTPGQIENIRKKEAETADALKRNPLNDYTEGWFHMMLNVHGEAPVLGYITGNAEAADISREMCMMMNEVVRTIVKKSDDWWKSYEW